MITRREFNAAMNSVTVTLCDPKSFEQQAYEWAVDGVLHYDRLIDGKSEFYLTANSVADIQRAANACRHDGLCICLSIICKRL